jgi:hypothetical protein
MLHKKYLMATPPNIQDGFNESNKGSPNHSLAWLDELLIVTCYDQE